MPAEVIAEYAAHLVEVLEPALEHLHRELAVVIGVVILNIFECQVNQLVGVEVVLDLALGSKAHRPVVESKHRERAHVMHPIDDEIERDRSPLGGPLPDEPTLRAENERELDLIQ